MTRGRASALALGLAALIAAPIAWPYFVYPSDRTPEGAYLRVTNNISRGRPEDVFAYIETEAQHACFTIGEYRRRARDLVTRSYPESERGRALEAISAVADAEPGPGVFGVYARREGWMDALRRDLSGVAKIDVQGERATVETVHGTRYPFRRRPENGIWGLTLFTATLVADAEKAARDVAMIERAAADYDAAKATDLR